MNSQLPQATNYPRDDRTPFVVGIDLGTTNSLLAVAGHVDTQHLLQTDLRNDERLSNEQKVLPGAVYGWERA